MKLHLLVGIVVVVVVVVVVEVVGPQMVVVVGFYPGLRSQGGVLGKQVSAKHIVVGVVALCGRCGRLPRGHLLDIGCQGSILDPCCSCGCCDCCSCIPDCGS